MSEEHNLEEAIRLAEIGEYLYNRSYSYGDGHDEPREFGIEWQWQQSKPDEFGQGALLAEAVKWHSEMAEDGIVTEATKLRSALSPTSDHTRVQGGVEKGWELAGEQWRAIEDGHPTTSWYPVEYGDKAGWLAIAKRHPEKYQVETRQVFAPASSKEGQPDA